MTGVLLQRGPAPGRGPGPAGAWGGPRRTGPARAARGSGRRRRGSTPGCRPGRRRRSRTRTRGRPSPARGLPRRRRRYRSLLAGSVRDARSVTGTSSVDSPAMKDRHTAGLYLEMSDGSPTLYAAERVATVLAAPAVTRATWWENVRQDANDLPRVLPEFGLLGVYEIKDGFEAPPHPGRDRRLPLPAADAGGRRLTGRPTIGLSLVLISPRDPLPPSRCGTGRLRAPAPHRGGGGARLLHGDPLRAHRGGRPAVPPLLRDGHRRPEASFQAMTPLVRTRLGDDDAFRAWAWHPALRIEYVNSFRRLGAACRVTDFFDVVHTQRACRSFAPKPLADGLPGRPGARRGDVRAERREPPAVGVHRRPS